MDARRRRKALLEVCSGASIAWPPMGRRKIMPPPAITKAGSADATGADLESAPRCPSRRRGGQRRSQRPAGSTARVAGIYTLANAIAAAPYRRTARLRREGAGNSGSVAVADDAASGRETCWEALGAHDPGGAGVIGRSRDPMLVRSDTVTIAVQVNGKLRGEDHQCWSRPEEASVRGARLQHGVGKRAAPARAARSREPRRVIVVKGRIVNRDVVRTRAGPFADHSHSCLRRVFPTASCGFHPLYGHGRQRREVIVGTTLSTVYCRADFRRGVGYDLRNDLRSDLFDATGTTDGAAYRLKLRRCKGRRGRRGAAARRRHHALRLHAYRALRIDAQKAGPCWSSMAISAR